MNAEERMRFAAGETDQLPPPPHTAAPLSPSGSRRDSDEADEND